MATKRIENCVSTSTTSTALGKALYVGPSGIWAIRTAVIIGRPDGADQSKLVSDLTVCYCCLGSHAECGIVCI